MKVFFRTVHLYLSLAAGLVIMIACLTGAILVFEKELQMAFNNSRYYVAAQGNPMAVDDLVLSVKAQHPEARLAGVKLYSDPERTVEIGLSFPEKVGKGNANEKQGAKPEGPKVAAAGKPAAQGGGRASHTAFVNPYTAEVVELYTYRETFFYKVFALHRWLLGSSDGIGKYIVGVSTFLFMFITITGIVLWWPKTRRILVQRLKIKQDAGWKRLNHDLHIVLGFYASIFLFIFSFTAMSWS
ncbi:MAG TPA: PepSY-associated TM helix domain-containing protein, partial [Sphingobacteriaceae bacterium]